MIQTQKQIVSQARTLLEKHPSYRAAFELWATKRVRSTKSSSPTRLARDLGLGFPGRHIMKEFLIELQGTGAGHWERPGVTIKEGRFVWNQLDICKFAKAVLNGYTESLDPKIKNPALPKLHFPETRALQERYAIANANAGTEIIDMPGMSVKLPAKATLQQLEDAVRTLKAAIAMKEAA